MMKKYSKLLLLVSILYTQNTVSDDIISFIEKLDNKTIILSIESLENQTKLSISGDQIYFDTFSENKNIILIENNEVRTYDFNNQLIIIESADETLLDVFNKGELSRYNMTEINDEESISLATYELGSKLLLIGFDNISKQIVSLQIQDEGVSLFETEIVDIIDFDVPLISNNFDSWEILDWRDVN